MEKEVSKLEVNLLQNFSVTNVEIDLQNAATETKVYDFGLQTYYCNTNGDEITDSINIKQGQSIKVCAKVGEEDEVVIDMISNFVWEKQDGQRQEAIDISGNSVNALTRISCISGDMTCYFESLLTVSFFTSVGIVSGSGNILLKFENTQQRALKLGDSNHRDMKDVSSKEDESYIGISTPPFQIEKYQFDNNFEFANSSSNYSSCMVSLALSFVGIAYFIT